MVLLSFCHSSSDPSSGAFTIKSMENDSNKYLCVNQLAFWMSAFVGFCYVLSCLEAHCLRATPSKPFFLLKFGQKGLTPTWSTCYSPHSTPMRDQNQPNKQKSMNPWIHERTNPHVEKEKITNRKRSSDYSHITLNAPNLILSQKLSRVRPG
jgi:hypothetical protein